MKMLFLQCMSPFLALLGSAGTVTTFARSELYRF
jgi:hypothetical protein